MANSANPEQGPVFQNLAKLLADMTLKISILKYRKRINIFCWKKLLTFLQQKYQCIWKYLSYNN